MPQTSMQCISLRRTGMSVRNISYPHVCSPKNSDFTVFLRFSGNILTKNYVLPVWWEHDHEFRSDVGFLPDAARRVSTATNTSTQSDLASLKCKSQIFILFSQCYLFVFYLLFIICFSPFLICFSLPIFTSACSSLPPVLSSFGPSFPSCISVSIIPYSLPSFRSVAVFVSE